MEADGLGAVPMAMVERLEAATGYALPPGYQEGLTPMFHLWEPLRCSPRPLTFYILSELVALWSHLFMTLLRGFTLQVRGPCLWGPTRPACGAAMRAR